jgi:hypothetical protein
MGDRSLEALQRFVADAVAGELAIESRPDLVVRANALLAPGEGRLDAAGRLGVYREQFWLRHLSSLGEDFPTLAWVTGAAPFREILLAYLKSHPPRMWNLQRLGAELPAFLSQHAPWRDDSLALDACRLDWAFMEAFDAPDARPLDLQALATAPEDAWPTARIELHPALRLLVLGHPAHELREAVKRGEAHARPSGVTTRLVVWRDAMCSLRATPVEALAFDLLGELARGVPLGLACATVASAEVSAEGDDFGARVGAWFQQWTAIGWVSAVRLSGGAV